MSENEQHAQSCLHAACDCAVETEGESYCCDTCRTDHTSGSMHICHCGHEGCAGAPSD